jgi:hypothetical protein
MQLIKVRSIIILIKFIVIALINSKLPFYNKLYGRIFLNKPKILIEISLC